MANENIGADEARLNITWGGYNGDLPDPVTFEATDIQIFQWASEAVRGGDVPGIPEDDAADFQGYMVARFAATADVPFNRLVLRPKVPFGG